MKKPANTKKTPSRLPAAPLATPPVVPASLNHTAAHRFLGCIMGAAIGDAVGFQVEFSPIVDQNSPGAVKDIGPGRFSDDTQMSEAALKAIIQAGPGADTDTIMGAIRANFIEWSHNPIGGHRAPGGECMAGCRRLTTPGHPWRLGGVDPGPMSGGGCGGPMKAHVFVAYMADAPRAVALAAEHSRLTHRHEKSLGACAAMAAGCIALIQGEKNWVGLMAQAAAQHSTEVARAIVDADEAAFHSINPESLDMQPRAFYDRNRGWDALTAVAAAVYCASRNMRWLTRTGGGGFKAAMLEGANTPGDSDSIASMAGALVGSGFGIEAIPGDWLCRLERVGDLFDLACKGAAFAGLADESRSAPWAFNADSPGGEAAPITQAEVRAAFERVEDPAATARAAIVDGFAPLNKKPGHFTALVAVRHVHMLPLADALKVLAGVLGRDSLTVRQVAALDKSDATKWVLILEHETGENDAWAVAYINGEWTEEDIVRQTGPHTTDEVRGMWSELEAWSEHIELEGYGNLFSADDFARRAAVV